MAPLSEEQLKQRLGYLGASEIPSVCGLNPFSGPIDVWLKKVGLAVEEEDPDAAFRKSLGHRIEALIAELYRERKPCELQECGSVVHPVETWAGCTPDRKIVGQRRGIEIKNVGMRVIGHWANNAPPDYVTCQAQWQCWIMDWEAIDIAALLGGRDFVIHEVLRDDELIRMMVDCGRQFWFEHVLTKEPPPVDGSDAYKEFLIRKYPNSRNAFRDATKEADLWASQYLLANDDESDAKRRKEEAGNHLRSLIGEVEGIKGLDWKATWSGADGKRTLRVKRTKKQERWAA